MADRLGTEESVSAAGMVRSFARWREAALKEPVFVTNHGRKTHVLLSIDQFEEMRTKSSAPEAISGPFELAEWIDEAIIVCDKELRILSINRAASATCRLSIGECVGKPLYGCLPQLQGTLLEIHLARTARANESTSADIPSPLRKDGWLNLQTFPLHDCNVLMFRDITEEVQRHRLADVKTALIEAMAVHSAIGYVRISSAGFIERVDEPFGELVGLPEQRLLGAKLVDLVSRDHRAAFKTHIEGTLSGSGPNRIETRFLSNRGTTESVVVAMVQLHGAYGAEGAVLLLTPNEPGSTTPTSPVAAGDD